MHHVVEAEVARVLRGRRPQFVHEFGLRIPHRALLRVRPRAARPASHAGVSLQDLVDGVLGQGEQHRVGLGEQGRLAGVRASPRQITGHRHAVAALVESVYRLTSRQCVEALEPYPLMQKHTAIIRRRAYGGVRRVLPAGKLLSALPSEAEEHCQWWSCLAKRSRDRSTSASASALPTKSAAFTCLPGSRSL